MVAIWPSFINCLMTSDALTAILCASSATVMVSGTWTSMTRASVGALDSCASSLPVRSRRPRGPPRQLLRPTPPLESPRVLISFFLACSSAQLEDSLALLISLLPGAAGAPAAGRSLAPGLPAGLCSVPLIGLTSTGGGTTFLGATFCGELIMSRIASASAKALRRRVSKSLALTVSSSALILAASLALLMTSSSASACAWVAASAAALSFKTPAFLALMRSASVCALASLASRARRFSASSSS